jgi:hypothetical protein
MAKKGMIEREKKRIKLNQKYEPKRQALLEEYESDRDEDENEKNMDDYVIKGEFLENGEIIFNKPIRSNTYYIYNK